MAQILANSVVGYPQSLAIFGRAVQNCGIRKTRYVDYSPTNDYTNQGVIQFTIPATGGSYIDLSKTRINLRAKIVFSDGETTPLPVKTPTGWRFVPRPGVAQAVPKAAGSAVPPANDAERAAAAAAKAAEEAALAAAEAAKEKDRHTCIVTGTNNFMHSAFNRVDVYLQNRLMTDSDGSYPYQAFFKTILQTPTEMKDRASQMQMFFNDDRGSHAGDVNWMMSENKGLTERGSFFVGSKEVDMCGKLAVDIFDQTRLLPNGLAMQISLYPSMPNFSLLSPDADPGIGYKVVITRASLEVCQVDVAPEIAAAHAEILTTEPALYPMIKTEVKKFAIAQGLYSAEINNPFEGRVPAELVLGIVDGEASHGSYRLDPFYFEHCHLNFLQATCNGEDLGNSPMTLKFGRSAVNSLFLEGYKSMLGVNGVPGWTPFGRESYFSGNTLFRFVAEQEESGMVAPGGGSVIPLRRTGNVRLTLKFDNALRSPKTIIVFAVFPSGFQIDKNRAIRDI